MNYQWFQSINQFAGNHPFVDQLMMFSTEKAVFIYAVVLAMMWIFGKERDRFTVFLAAITGAFGLFINFVIGHIYFEPRPFVTHNVHLLLSHAANASFPSDHTTGAFALSIIIFLRQRKIGTGMIFLAFLTGISRVYVGHHYPLDIFGSIGVAIIVTILIYKADKFLKMFFTLILSIYNKIPFTSNREEKKEHYVIGEI
ncbi:undecaprenyl-diphosphatase [Bacillus sp. ISL-18]|uniref:undecaprenyl-diphosphatase n=1 Tax=Bacillus sp. ISL-18 TaxID=2819118 RepID=UPI001BEBF63E|nr:undecaprenyl-diphosphatase [Bacillus sp. ISL-18]MBT2655841.1 undecaprenyl-diphosphatase [Bacillus sp. ISL-18]